MIKSLIILIFVALFFSCKTSQEIISYEFSQKQQVTAHWESKRYVNLVLSESNKFSVQIIESSFYGDLPFSDTVNIIGSYIKTKKEYELSDLNDTKVNFKISRFKNKILFKGTYYNRRNLSYTSIQNQSIF